MAPLGLALAVFVLLVRFQNDGNPNFVLLSAHDEHAVIALDVFLVGLWFCTFLNTYQGMSKSASCIGR